MLKGTILFLIWFPIFFLSFAHLSFASDELEYHRVFGIGSGFGFIPNYPSSKRTDFHYMFFPFYEGKVLKMDQNEGVRNEILANDHWNIGINYVFNFPVISANNEERTGMPDLNWLVQVGPQFKYHFLRKDRWLFSLFGTIQANVETTFTNTWKLHGVLFNPGVRIKYDFKEAGELQFRYEFNLSSSEYQQYYYGVAQEYATATRPQYTGQAGWQSLIVGFIYSYSWGNWVAFVSPNYYHYGLGAHQKSPLHSVDENFAMIFGLTYKFGI